MNIELLKKQKQKLKLSYDEIAKISGIPKTTVTNILTGRTLNPRIDTLNAIENALEITDGVTQEEYNAGFRSTKKESITPKEDIMLYYFRIIGQTYGESMQDAAINLLKNMAENSKK